MWRERQTKNWKKSAKNLKKQRKSNQTGVRNDSIFEN